MNKKDIEKCVQQEWAMSDRPYTNERIKKLIDMYAKLVTQGERDKSKEWYKVYSNKD